MMLSRLEPTAAQRAAVRALHAKATWSNYGTPATLMRPGGFLTKQATGATAVVAARGWLAKHRVIFRLASVSGLQVKADSKLAGIRGHAITFQQAFSGLKTVEGVGLVTVGLTPGKAHRWPATGPFTLPAYGEWTVGDVERLLAEQGDAFPEQREELDLYLDSFRSVAGPGGRLPGDVDLVVEDVFADLIRRAR